MKGGYNFSFPTLLHFLGELLLKQFRCLHLLTVLRQEYIWKLVTWDIFFSANHFNGAVEHKQWCETVQADFFSSRAPRSCIALRFLPRLSACSAGYKPNELGDRIIKQLWNSFVAKYRDLSASPRSVIRLSLQNGTWLLYMYLHLK